MICFLYFYFRLFYIGIKSQCMADTSLLMKLLPQIDRFEKELGGVKGDLADFCKWLNENLQQQQDDDIRNEKLQWHGKDRGGKAHFTASNLLTAISRYKNSYVKAALEGSPFETYDEFAFVLSLVFVGPYSQSALIERHVQLKPTGVEIIKRLIKKKLVMDAPDEHDKRSKILTVTPEGRSLFHAALLRINMVTDLMMSPLDEQEKLTLLHLLQKLDTPHRQFFNEHKKITLDAMQQYFSDVQP